MLLDPERQGEQGPSQALPSPGPDAAAEPDGTTKRDDTTGQVGTTGQDGTTRRDGTAEETDVPVLPAEPVPAGVVVAFAGASGLPSSLVTDVVANVTAAVKTLADIFGFQVAEPVVALTEPLPGERQ